MDSPVLNSLSNSTRLMLLCCLAKDKKNVRELIDTCGLAQSAVSQHLKKLKSAGLVKDEKYGKFVYYSLANPNVSKIANSLNDFVKGVK